MSTLRYNPCHHRELMRLHSGLNDAGVRPAGIKFGKERACTDSGQSFLSVVVAAKNEAASLPRLIDEITWALPVVQ